MEVEALLGEAERLRLLPRAPGSRTRLLSSLDPRGSISEVRELANEERRLPRLKRRRTVAVEGRGRRASGDEGRVESCEVGGRAQGPGSGGEVLRSEGQEPGMLSSLGVEGCELRGPPAGLRGARVVRGGGSSFSGGGMSVPSVREYLKLLSLSESR